jgi:hypothetical protein
MSRQPARPARSLCLALGVLAIAAAPSTAAPDPPLTVAKATLDRAMHCHGEVRDARRAPIMLVTGTGGTGEEAYLLAKGAFAVLGRPVCDIDFPDYTTADIQVSVQYLVRGIRVMARRAQRPIAVVGISQGGLLPRWALAYWPSLRRHVSDVVAVAGTQHGTTVFTPAACALGGCAPALWQQAAGSKLLAAIDRRPDETPRRTSWTTVRSLTDEVVRPQGGPRPASALMGASNILIQRVCPGRVVGHVASLVDSVTFAAVADALAHRGPARVSRLPAGVCSRPFATGLDPVTTAALLSTGLGLVALRIATQVPRVKAEPPVRAYARLRPGGAYG